MSSKGDVLDGHAPQDYRAAMSNKLDTFKARLLEAAKRKRLPPSQTEIGKHLGVDKRLVDTWMSQGSTPRAEMVFQIADRLGVSARWLASGAGAMVDTPAGLEQHEQDLIVRYRTADPRWQLSLRLLSYVATEDQPEIAGDVNMVIARVFGKRPQDIKYISDAQAAAAIGPLPTRERLRVAQPAGPEYSAKKRERKHRRGA